MEVVEAPSLTHNQAMCFESLPWWSSRKDRIEKLFDLMAPQRSNNYFINMYLDGIRIERKHTKTNSVSSTPDRDTPVWLASEDRITVLKTGIASSPIVTEPFKALTWRQFD